MALSPSPVPVRRSNPVVRRALALAFPDWKGRKVRVVRHTGPHSLDLNWSGGTRDAVALIDLGSGRVADLRVGAPWTHDGIVDHGPGTLLVVHSTFVGNDAGVTFCMNVSHDDSRIDLLTA